jgi:hypothetical protein
MIVLFVIMLLLLFVRVRAEGDAVSTSVTILNAVPSVDEVHVNTVSGSSFSDALLLLPSPGGARTVYINGAAIDPNGDTEITSIQAVFYQSGGESCPLSGIHDDKNTCYRNTNCSIQNVDGDDSVTFTCSINMQYYANATSSTSDNWIARVFVYDELGAEDDTSTTTEVGEIISVTPETSINFGSLYAGESTNAETNAHTIMTQAGNSPADVNISGTPMTCTDGSIPSANMQYTITDVPGGIPVTSQLTTLTTFNLPVRTNDVTPMTKTLYWNLTVPLGVSGDCAGSVVLTAVADS